MKLGHSVLSSLPTIGKMVGARRKFDGKPYTLILATHKKAKARQKARGLKGRGKLVRITYRKDYKAWFVWQR